MLFIALLSFGNRCHSGELNYVWGNLFQFNVQFRDNLDLPFNQFVHVLVFRHLRHLSFTYFGFEGSIRLVHHDL
jgi:hypothetical protein